MMRILKTAAEWAGWEVDTAVLGPQRDHICLHPFDCDPCEAELPDDVNQIIVDRLMSIFE